MKKKILAALVGVLLIGGASFADEESPNVVLIFADDLGYGDLGCYGATKVKTPNIDRLAAEGRKFIDAHSSAAVCTPSRYGLLTGEYPFKARDGQGVWGPAPVTSPLLIDPETNTIGDIFKKSGYETAVFGKWHLGFKEGRNDWQEPLRPGPQDLGFDYYFGMPVVNSAPPYVYVENDRVVKNDPKDPLRIAGKGESFTPITPIPREAAQRSGNRFAGAVEAHKLFNDFEVGTKLTEKATEWIKAREGKPFFAYFSTTNVHHPFTPAKRFQGTSKAGWYGDFVHELDWIVGEVMKSLEESGVADNTLVIFTSDNGGMFNHGGRAAAELGHNINGDLLGSKFGIWEGGHRVPFIAWWPGKIEAGTVSDQLLCGVDLIASFAALTGRELEDPKDSINMLPALTGAPEKPLRTEMFMTPHKQSHMALRRGKWMFIPAKSDGGFTGSKPEQHAWGGAAVTTLVGTPNSDIENGQIKDGAPPAQLYDLETDTNQTKNVYYDNLDLANEMAAAIKQARKDAGFTPGYTSKSRAAVPAKNAGPALSKYDGFKPVGNVHYSFESGTLDGWEIIDGELGEAVTKVASLIRRKDEPFARHGSHHLSTLVVANGKPLSDTQTAVIQSPTFTLTGDKIAFLVAGGYDPKDLYVALLDAKTGGVLKKTGGSRDHRMRRVEWNVAKWKGKAVRFEVVDQVTGGWGHLNVDDFSVEGEVTGGRKEMKTPKPQAAVSTEKTVKKKSPRDFIEKPNFVIIFADDLGYGDISCYNPEAPETPNLDQLAAEGFRSTDFFIPANVCSPSRAALLTGRYPMRCGMPVARNENHPKYTDYGFAPDEITIPELLKEADYRSLIVGKWHLGMEIEGSHPLDAGFDEHLGIASNYEKKRGTGFNHLYRGREVEAENVPFQALTERYTDEAIEFIENQRDKPFLIFFSHHIPHTPHLPREEFAGVSGKGKYSDVIQELDHSTGRIMKALVDAGIDDNTLVVFTSDNGPGGAGSAGPLSGGKFGTMEGGHHVPGIFRWPGQIPAGQVSDVTLTSMDLLPLFCGLAGVDQPGDRKIDGAEIFPILSGRETASPHPFLYYYNGTNLQAVREGEWKLHLPRTPQDQPFWNKRANGGRLFVSLEQNALFNLKEDLGEKENVADQNPEVVERLLAQADAIRAELGEVNVKGSDQRDINLIDPQER
ncbi:sulfatase-like hydrolase/transferase [Verrucomicrobiales bacterium]|nr:sulfatase-like hydrolase/transferase [Verrucomicrobiales bacterium]